MQLAATTPSHPLREDKDGVIRIGATRVTLQSVLDLFEQGAGAEEIALRFPSLCLADVYSTLGFFLVHRAEMKTYLGEQLAASLAARDETEGAPAVTGLRERLLHRVRD